MFFFAITKNLNWEILTQNLVTFKRWDGVKDEKFQYYGSSLKNSISRGVLKNHYTGGNSIKGWAWAVCRFKWACYLMHTMLYQ